MAGPLDRECAALVKQLRERCPQVLPAEPLAPGHPGEPVPVEAHAARVLITTALRQAVSLEAGGRLPATDEALPGVVVWTDGASALAVEVAKVAVETGHGEVVFVVPVRCDQASQQRGLVRVSFTVGTPERPTGLLAATARRPAGPRIVVDRWGEALTALCWRALLDAVAGVAAATGRDRDGSPLVVTALTATPDGLRVLPQARHPFDRVGPGRAVPAR